MLSVKRSMLLYLLCLTTATATAQQSSPPTTPAFANQPSSIELPVSILSNAMLFAKGQQVSISLSKSFMFQGDVISNDQVYHNLQTIIVRSPAFNNALLQISKQTNNDRTVTYAAQIFGNKSSDGFHLKHFSNGNYSLEKFETIAVLQDCHLQ